MWRSDTSQGEWKKEEQAIFSFRFGPQVAGDNTYVVLPHLCTLQWHFCPRHWSFWQGSHLLCNWWDEGEDRLRWIISICCYVGCLGCSPEVTELGIIAIHSKLQATGGNRTKTPGQGSRSALRSLLAQEWRLGRMRMSHPSPLTALTRRGLLWLPPVNRTPQIMIVFC